MLNRSIPAHRKKGVSPRLVSAVTTLGRGICLVTTLARPGNFRVGKISHSDESVWIDNFDDAKTRGFAGVPKEVWIFISAVVRSVRSGSKTAGQKIKSQVIYLKHIWNRA